MNASKIGVYKEKNKKITSQNNSMIWTSKIFGKSDIEISSDEEELSDIRKKSEEDSSFIDDDFTSNLNTNFINNKSISDNDEILITQKEKKEEDIFPYFDSLFKYEPDLDINSEEGFSQMVDKSINKLYNDPDYSDTELEVLMIAEKPSLARIISEILSNNRCIKYSGDGMTIYTFQRLFKGRMAFFTVSSVRGHVYQDNFDKFISDREIFISYEEKENFHRKNNKLFETNVVKTLKIENDENNNKNKNLNIPQFLRNLGKGKDILCLWLDCDPEGENICYEVIHNVLPYMNKRNYQQIYRAQFNSLTPKDIKDSFNNLFYYPNLRLSMSVDARSLIDFKVGVLFTKLFSSEILSNIKEIEKIKEDGKKTYLSYGPCQTPTLWFCVKRLKERKNFERSIHYKIYIEIEDDRGEIFKLYMNRKFKNKKKLYKRLNKIKFHFFVELKNIKKTKKKIDPPVGLKTTTMLKMASLKLGLSPYKASKDAQNLYMNGLISYPRTGSTKYSKNYDFENSLKMFCNNPHFSKKVKVLLENFKKENIDFSRGEEIGGHEPIIPTDSTNKKNIKKNLNWDLYKCICQYYFASLSQPMKYENMEYEFYLGKYKLEKTFSKIIKEGFLNFLPLNNKNFVPEFPSFKENSYYKIINIDYEKRCDSPPDYITEAELIDEMAKYNIGTDGSIPNHINNLSIREYVKVNKHRRIIPTKLGITLIDALDNVCPEIIRPENRALIEKFVKQIETGEREYNETIEAALDFYEKRLIHCVNNIDEIKKEFEKKFDMYNL